MQYDDDDYDFQESLHNTVREARKQLRSKPLYIVASARGYDIVDRLPEGEPVSYRVNMDGSITIIVSDNETHKLLELHGHEHPASEQNATVTDLAFEEYNYG